MKPRLYPSGNTIELLEKLHVRMGTSKIRRTSLVETCELIGCFERNDVTGMPMKQKSFRTGRPLAAH